MTDETDLTSLRLRVEGFVQAVGYRNFAIGEAARLGLDGWIRNRTDGTVEILVSGGTKVVEAFVADGDLAAPPVRGSRMSSFTMPSRPSKRAFIAGRLSRRPDDAHGRGGHDRDAAHDARGTFHARPKFRT